MCVAERKRAIDEGDAVAVEEVFPFLTWDSRMGGILGVAGDVDAVESHFAVLRVAKGCAVDSEAERCHVGCIPGRFWGESNTETILGHWTRERSGTMA